VLKKTLCLLAFVITLLPCIPVKGQTATDIVVERNVAMKTRDGVTLRADIYRPAGEGPFPVLLQRTPYNKDTTATLALRAASRGYLFVAQDVRGRYASEGEWYTFKHEIERWLRCRRVGGGAATLQRQGGHGQRFLRRRNADAGRH
jgi:dienelactone hydrolase